MKSKILLPFIFFFLLFATSCKKESTPAIVGSWRNTAVYSDPSRGGYGWVTEIRYPQVITFENNARFYSRSDVPEGAGVYDYNYSSRQLQLQYEADSYGTPAHSVLKKVETLTSDKLVIIIQTGNGMIYKQEYSKVN